MIPNLPSPSATPDLVKDVIEQIGVHRDAAFAQSRSLLKRFFIVFGLLLICLFLPDDVAPIPLLLTILAALLVSRKIDIARAKIDAYHASIDILLASWRLDLDSTMALLSTMLPPVEPDREINDG